MQKVNMKAAKLFSTLFLSIAVSAVSLFAQTFSDFLARENAAPNDSVRQAIVDSFITAQTPKGFPVKEDSIAYFVYRGSVSAFITVAGDFNGWSPTSDPMTHIAGTNFYFLQKKFETDARLDYKFVNDRNTWILDPLNPHTIIGGVGPNSELAMPDYIQPTEIIYNTVIPHGTTAVFSFYSAALNNNRNITVYLPPGYDSSAKKYPTLYVHDGPDYLNLGSMKNVLDNLIATNVIEPVICIFVPPVSAADRSNEYRLSKVVQFSTFITKELVPHIDSLYRTDTSAVRRGTLGSSDGGHVSLYLATHFPSVFRLCAGQSSTIDESVRLPIEKNSTLPIKFYLDCGTYDIATPQFNFITLNRQYWSLLRSKGYDLTSVEFHEGHSWGNWRAHLDNILKTLYPAVPAGFNNKHTVHPEGFLLYPNFPNPFNSPTTIKYRVPYSTVVNLRIYDILGREIFTAVNHYHTAGTYSVQVDGSSLPSGVYRDSLFAGSEASTTTMLLV